MNDLETRNDLERREDNYPSTSTLSRQGLTAVACTAGGIFLFIMQRFAGMKAFGFIVGGIACVLGVISMLSKDSADKKAGMVIGGAGILVLLSKIGLPFISPLSGTLIGIGAVGLLALGVWNAIKFFKGLKKRS
jgi:hypothetical protein